MFLWNKISGGEYTGCKLLKAFDRYGQIIFWKVVSSYVLTSSVSKCLIYEPVCCSCRLDSYQSPPQSQHGCSRLGFGPYWITGFRKAGLQCLPYHRLTIKWTFVEYMLLCLNEWAENDTGQSHWEENRTFVIVPKYLINGLSGTGRPISRQGLVWKPPPQSQCTSKRPAENPQG